MSKRYLIIGDGAAGTTAAQYIRQADKNGRIEIYSDDPNPAYFRAALTNYLIGELREDQVWAVPPTFYHENSIKRKLARVARVDTQNSQIHLSQSSSPEPYDQLLIAAGSRARPAPFEGANLSGVLTMRTLQDVRQVMDSIKVHGLRQAVIVGGGPLAMEWVQGLHERDVHVTYLLRGDRIMSRVLDKTASDLTLARMRLAGIDVRLNTEIIAAMPSKDGQLAAIRTNKGDTISCQLAGIAIGVICNSEFLKGSGLTLSKKGGIIVNSKMQTNVTNIYAAGDIATLNDEMLQLWEPAKLQGRVAAINMSGGHANYHIGAHYNATRLYDLDFASVGQLMPTNGDETITDFPQGQGRIAYRKIIVRDNKLVGAIMVGQRQEKVRARGRLFKKLIDSGQTIGPIKEQLLDPAFDLKAWLNTRDITSKPKFVAQAAGAPPPAQLRRTQMLKPAELRQATAAATAPTATSSRPIASLHNTENDNDVQLGEYARIGRTPDNTLIIDDQFTSSRHAEIRWQNNSYQLTDLGSSNGTFINDDRVTTMRLLQDGDQVRFGRTTFAFNLKKAVTTPPTASSSVPSTTGTIIAPPPATQGNFLASIGLGTQQLAKPILVDQPNQPPILQGDGQSWELVRPTISIGRDPENDIVLEDEGASHVHAHIVKQGEQLFLRDLGSRNGTWANQEQVTLPFLLRDGDHIFIGHTQLVFRHPQSPRRRRRPEPEAETPAPSDKQPFHLTIRSGSSIGLTFDLTKKTASKIGRNEESDIWINDPSISFTHATIEQQGKQWSLTDNNSSNGTYINEKQITASTATPLTHGDELYFGQVAALFHTTHCGHCQAEVKASTKFCAQCGTNLSESQKNL